MNLRSVDLNLLVIFHALMAERHVTRAAGKIAMSQPAMSNALARLRHIFKDELFIRNGGRMEPTPRAIELGSAVEQVLRQVERLMSTEEQFNPATSDRSFNARMSDLIGILALPDIVAELRRLAPSVSLNILHMPPDRTLAALESDELDFALSFDLTASRSIRAEPLFKDQMCCVMGPQHPLAKKPLTLKAFLDYPHMRVAISPSDVRFVDNVLAEQGKTRKVAVNVPHWLLVPPTLRESDLLAVVTRKLAARFSDTGLITRSLPYKSPPFSWTLYWHRRYEKSVPQVWVRKTIQQVCRRL